MDFKPVAYFYHPALGQGRLLRRENGRRPAIRGLGQTIQGSRQQHKHLLETLEVVLNNVLAILDLLQMKVPELTVGTAADKLRANFVVNVTIDQVDAGLHPRARSRLANAPHRRCGAIPRGNPGGNLQFNGFAEGEGQGIDNFALLEIFTKLVTDCHKDCPQYGLDRLRSLNFGSTIAWVSSSATEFATGLNI